MNPTPSLVNKIAIVTGANRGIGRAIAQRLAQDGAAVMLAARNASLLETAAGEIREAGGRAHCVSLDLCRPEAPAQLVKEALANFGVVDIVVNNAGATKRGNFLELTEEDWADGYGLKFFGAVRLARAAWPHLAQRQGSLVNIAGIGGRTPGAEFAIGGSVNAALLSLTKSLAEIGIRDGVQVNAINPGAIRTERLEKRLQSVAQETETDAAGAEAEMLRRMKITRFGETRDVADFVAYLVSPAGRFFQGALIDLDGGETKTM